jgi:hypothetical protein
MTAEVAIANLSAIAMAADSAVTIGGQKIYNSALKLFSLSKVAPVGTMVYGNAALLDVPWETLIKSHRKWLGNSLHENLVDYASSFIAFLQSNLEFFPEDSQKRWLECNVRHIFTIIRNELFDEIRSAQNDNDQISLKQVTDLLSDISKKYQVDLRNKDHAQGFSDKDNKNIRTTYSDTIKQLMAEVFETIKIPPRTVYALSDIAALVHTKGHLENC